MQSSFPDLVCDKEALCKRSSNVPSFIVVVFYALKMTEIIFFKMELLGKRLTAAHFPLLVPSGERTGWNPTHLGKLQDGEQPMYPFFSLT